METNVYVLIERTRPRNKRSHPMRGKGMSGGENSTFSKTGKALSMRAMLDAFRSQACLMEREG